MKKIVISFSIVAVAVLTYFATHSRNNFDTQFEANVNALASTENPITTCNTYCYDRSSWVCVLTTIYGYDINCIDMYLKPEYQ